MVGGRPQASSYQTGSVCRNVRSPTLPAVNKIYIGQTEVVLPKGPLLFIHDEVPTLPYAKIFDPNKHSFNLLKDIDYRTARDLATVLYTLYPQGESTLTVRNGKRALLSALLASTRFDDISGDEEVTAMIGDILQSPVLKNVLCNTPNFHLDPKKIVLARVNRAELGDFDCTALTLFLMAHYKGQLVIPDFGFYARDIHISLIRENRLIAGVRFLDQLPEKLRLGVLLVPEKVVGGAIYDDALLLAKHAGLHPDQLREENAYNQFVEKAMEPPEPPEL